MGRVRRRLLALLLLAAALFVRGGSVTKDDKGDWFANPSLTRPQALIGNNEETAVFSNAINSQPGDAYRVVVSLLANVDPRRYRQTIDTNTDPVKIRLAAVSKTGRELTITEVSVPQDGQYHYYPAEFVTDADYSDLQLNKVEVGGVATVLVGDMSISRLQNQSSGYRPTVVGEGVQQEQTLTDQDLIDRFAVGRVLARQRFTASQSDLQSVRLSISPSNNYGQGSMLVKLYDGNQLVTSSVMPWPAIKSYRDARQSTDYRLPLTARLTVGREYTLQVEMADDASAGVLNRPRLIESSKIVPQYVTHAKNGDRTLLFGQIEQDLGGGHGRLSYTNFGDTLGLLDSDQAAAVNTQLDKNWGIVGIDVSCTAKPLTYHLQSAEPISYYSAALNYDRSATPTTLPSLRVSTDGTNWTSAELTSRQLVARSSGASGGRDLYLSVECSGGVGFVMQKMTVEAETQY